MGSCVTVYYNVREIDGYLQQSEAQFDALCRRARAANSLLYRKLDEARQHLMARS